MYWAVENLRLTLRSLPVLLLLGLSGCASHAPEIVYQSPIPHIDTTLFGKRPENIVTPSEIFKLEDEQRKYFLDYFNNPKYKNKDSHMRIAKFLENLLEDFEYTSETNSAETTLASRSGDCMSLATLTTALALETGVDITYRAINNTPFFDQRGDFAVRSNHIRSILYKPELDSFSDTIVQLQPSVKIDFFPTAGDVAGRRIVYRQFLGMYYRNLAALELIDENYNRAFWLTFEAVRQAPYDHENINLMAVLHRRTGNETKAEQLYQYGIEHAISKVGLLRNYRILLNHQKRFDEAEKISSELKNLDDANPFYWIDLANHHYSNNEHDSALFYYRKAIKVAPYLHHGYQGLARTYFQLNKLKQAEAALKKALENSDDETLRTRFKNKLSVLRTQS